MSESIVIRFSRVMGRTALSVAKIAVGTIIGLMVMASLSPGKAVAQIPADAAKYKHQLRQQAHLVWGLDAPVAAFAAQIHQESQWNAVARSRVGAVGLAQFMPSTATWISGIYTDLSDNSPTNPTWAMRALLRYDKYLADRVAATDSCEQMAFAMSGYNGGLGWVNKRKARSPQPLVCFGVTCEINPGISPANQRENADYPRRILRKYEPIYAAAGWGKGACTS